jgi:hypothetical protein
VSLIPALVCHLPSSVWPGDNPGQWPGLWDHEKNLGQGSFCQFWEGLSSADCSSDGEAICLAAESWSVGHCIKACG